MQTFGGTQTGPERADAIISELVANRVVVRAQAGLPILSISTQASTPEQAQVLARATTEALREYFRQFQNSSQGYAALAQLKTLNVSRGGAISSGTSLSKGLMVAAFVFGLGCLIVVFFSGLLGELRTQRSPLARHDDAWYPAEDGSPSDQSLVAESRDPVAPHAGR